MTLAEQIAPHLPYLRRFSRALTGNQSSGDAYISALLESVIEEPKALGAEPNVRLALYHMLCLLWKSVSINLKPDSQAEHWEVSAQRRIAPLPPRARQAFLLTGLEGFSVAETASILDTDAEEVASLISEAGEDIARQMRTDVLVIEDEPLIALDLESLVTGLGHKVIGVARTHTQAVEMARRKKPGLVLADIQLADASSGIDAVNEILRGVEVPVIFITAYPERLLTGERPEPAFLITKPFMPEMVRAVIGQALFFDTRSHSTAKPAAARN
jgi:DNA-directed RNA polymerase specialized sigma24 family protein/CheY-like chemotaxis protein